MLKGEVILIVGGSGSLGNQLIQTYLSDNHIINYSRDENKHWSMDLKYQSKHLQHVIGDIRDATKIRQTLIRHQPSIIIIAAALKHIDRCEYEINESINTNIIGIQNILDTIETNLDQLTPKLKTVCFISTDKACSPVNIYGMCKSICEGLMVEKAKYVSKIKFVCVRYGNVLNSRGSIIPILETRCQNGNELTLTSDKMTRFIMTLEESVALIEYAILRGSSGDIVIPQLRAMKIADLFELFSEKYKMPIRITGLRSGEKIHESLINDTQAMRTVVRVTPNNVVYYHIRPSFAPPPIDQDDIREGGEYHSGLDNVSKEELLGYLTRIGLFEIVERTNTTLCERISDIAPHLFQAETPFPHAFIDQVLPPGFASQAQLEILQIPDNAWDRYQNPFESKWTLRDKNSLPPTVQAIFDQLTSPVMVQLLSSMVGTKLRNDPDKHYWGVHKYDTDDFLKIHVDAGVHPKAQLKKQLTLGIYLSHCWHQDDGCDLEIWSGDSSHSDDAKIWKCIRSIAPVFNRAVLFSNTDNSWHGNPSRFKGTANAKRIFLTVSYLSDDQSLYQNKRTRAFFRPRPNEISEHSDEFLNLSLQRASEENHSQVYRVLI